jgi:sulfide:quinone oxidoreductase
VRQKRSEGSGDNRALDGDVSFRVVVCGGGIAAAEALLRLRRLTGDAVELRVIAPNEALVYRPLAVREPFTYLPPRRYPLRQIATNCGAELTKDDLRWIDTDERIVHTGEGRDVGYDALLVAVGARELEPYGHPVTFRAADAAATFGEVIKAIELGRAYRVAFIQPAGPCWPLPLYELALMTATHADELGIPGLELAVITAEPRPLAVFGEAVAEVIAVRLAGAGIRLYTKSQARMQNERRLIVEPSGAVVATDRVLAMPRLSGPAIAGLAGDAQGFVPIDEHCCVPGTGGRVFAAGDAASHPIKHGGLGAQMADSAASAIATLVGAVEKPQPFRPVIRARLATGADPIYLSARQVAGDRLDSAVFEQPPWPAGDKVVADELGPYLASLDASP